MLRYLKGRVTGNDTGWKFGMSQMSASSRGKPNSVVLVCVYVAAYVILDHISSVQALPTVGFTLWNPPPACSLALLLLNGFRFVPALFGAAALADVVNGFASIGILPALALDVIVAAGYTVVALALRPFVRPAAALQSVRAVSWCLAILSVGVLGVAGSVGLVLVLMDWLPANQFAATVRHFWVGDVTGIVGLFPVLMTASLAWRHWQELPWRMRVADVGAFALGLASALWILFIVAPPEEFQFFYLLLLPVFWVGVRHGLPWCAVAILTEQAMLVAFITLLGYPASDFIAFQIVSLAVALAGLVLGAVVTERQCAELQLRQQQAELGRVTRLTTAAALGSAIVHEISQPLATVATYAYACRRLPSAGPQAEQLLGETLAKIELEALRAGEIVERLRDFIAQGDMQLAPLALAEVARQVAATLVDEARVHGVEVSIEAQSEESIVADRVQVQQLLLNLIRNGIEAAAERVVGEKWVRVRISQSVGEIRVDVEDNGRGVPPEIVERLFEPFTTSKSRGMGLGLLLSRQIVDSHGGRLWCERTSRTGAHFALRLPRERANVDVR
jgi:two-component system, LuxR family, sensor kinase FixL